MAISNYGELKTAVQTWLKGNTAIATNAENIVALAQSWLNTELRCREMETETDLSPTDGEFTLPTDYAYYKYVVELDTNRRPLSPIRTEKADILYPTRPAGNGKHFSIKGSTLRVYKTTSNDIELTYYQRLAAFSDDSDYDWLLTRYPHVYMVVCQMIGADLANEDGEFSKYASLARLAVENLNTQDDVNELEGFTHIPEGDIA